MGSRERGDAEGDVVGGLSKLSGMSLELTPEQQEAKSQVRGLDGAMVAVRQKSKAALQNGLRPSVLRVHIPMRRIGEHEQHVRLRTPRGETLSLGRQLPADGFFPPRSSPPHSARRSNNAGTTNLTSCRWSCRWNCPLSTWAAAPGTRRRTSRAICRPLLEGVVRVEPWKGRANWGTFFT